MELAFFLPFLLKSSVAWWCVALWAQLFRQRAAGTGGTGVSADNVSGNWHGCTQKTEKDEGSSWDTRGRGKLQEANGKTRKSSPMAVMAVRKYTLHPLIMFENGLEVSSLAEHCFSSKQYEDLCLASLNLGVGYTHRHENRRSKGPQLKYVCLLPSHWITWISRN